MNNRVGVVIVAAGRGSRMGTQESKQFLLLRDKPIFIHTLEIFAAMPEVDEMVMVTGTGDVERCRIGFINSKSVKMYGWWLVAVNASIRFIAVCATCKRIG